MEPKTQFDSLADTYAVEEFPIKTWVESPTLYRALGDVQGQDVIDLGCGNGLYARSLKKRGARRLIGIDISTEMIRVAREVEQRHPVGIEYAVHDAAELPDLGEFDVALAIHLLHYAPTVASLSAMCRGAARHLRPGGRFVALVMNADYDDLGAETKQYGYVVHMPAQHNDGERITMDILAGAGFPTRGGAFSIHFQYYRRTTYERVLRAAGLHQFGWHRFDVAMELPAEYKGGFWDQALRNPYSDVLTCTKTTHYEEES